MVSAVVRAISPRPIWRRIFESRRIPTLAGRTGWEGNFGNYGCAGDRSPANPIMQQAREELRKA